MKAKKLERIRVNEFMRQVYSWMTFALAVTGFVSIAVASSPALIKSIISNPYIFFGIMIVEIIAVLILIAFIDSLNFETAFVLFFGYSALNGLTFSILFLAYTSASIATTFFITAGTFGIMSLYGYTTKTDLSSWGNILFMGLIGLILAGGVNLFIGSELADYLISFVGVIVFVGYTAYDTQKIKELSEYGDSKEALLGALSLYLDFVNLFLYLLRFLGNKK